jgi:hypothetical protein
MIVKSQVFKSASESWESMCTEVSDFASQLGPDRLINISVAAAGGQELFGMGAEGVIVVWYWD